MSEKVLMKGNEAIAEAAIMSGCRFFFGYPITPQNEIPEYFAKRMPQVGGLCIQAESEVAAINMVLGASAAGSRVMTSSSSPGISLKGEGISYMVGSDLPCVIVNIQRGGPGLGGIQPAQSDYFQATRALGHGDMRIIVLAPASVQEMASLTAKAFDLADEYRSPVMVLADGALGQMMEPMEFNFEKKAAPCKDWAVGHGGGKRNIVNSLYIDPAELEKKVAERFKRYDVISEKEVMYEEDGAEGADIVVVAYGISARIAKAAVKSARKKGINIGILRPITLWPFPDRRIAELAGKVKCLLCAELSMGQMAGDVRLAANGACPVEFVGRTGGVIFTSEEIEKKIDEIAGGIKQ